MTICLRYTNTREEASEVLNDGFMKAFSYLADHKMEQSFKGWLRKILVNTAIDHYRKYQQQNRTVDLAYAEEETSEAATVLEAISAEEILQLVQKLPPAYRLVFNLYAIEGFTHPEIAEKLQISEGASKSNLFKARAKLQRMIRHLDHEEYTRYAQ